MLQRNSQEARAAVHEILRSTTQEEIIENRRKKGTRTQYGTRIKRMVRFIRNKFPEVTDLVDENNWLRRPVPTVIMKELVNLFNERGIDSFSTFVSNSAFGGFVATFKYWHEMSDEKRSPDSPPIIIPTEHETYLSKYSEGRKRKIAELRHLGLLSS